MEDCLQLGLEGDERSVLHDLHIGLMPRRCSRRYGGRGFRLVDERVNCRIVEAAPVGTRVAELTVEDVREDGSTIGRTEPVGAPTRLGDVPMAGLEAVGRSHADA